MYEQPSQESEKEQAEEFAEQFYKSHQLEIRHDYDSFVMREQEYKEIISDIDKILAKAEQGDESTKFRANKVIMEEYVPRARARLAEMGEAYQVFSKKYKPSIQAKVEKDFLNERRKNRKPEELREDIKKEIQENSRISHLERQFGITEQPKEDTPETE